MGTNLYGKSFGSRLYIFASYLAHRPFPWRHKSDLRNIELFSSFARNSEQKLKLQVAKIFTAVVPIDAMSHRKFTVPMTVQKSAGATGLACSRWRELPPGMGFPSRADSSFSPPEGRTRGDSSRFAREFSPPAALSVTGSCG